MNDPIRGKVARVLNSREVALNVGSNDGVELDMCFKIMDRKLEGIRDPDSNQLLGSIERPKVQVKVTHVQEKLSLASTYRTTKVNKGGSGSWEFGMLSKALLPPNWETKYETLKTDEKTWEDLDERESFVKVGDPVVQVLQLSDGGEILVADT